MAINRRELLIAGTGLAGGMLLGGGLRRVADAAASVSPGIDRQALVARHHPTVNTVDPFSALSVGNGSFAFTADVTGLQTFTADYEKEFPLCTAAHWAWHTIPAPAKIAGEQYQFHEYNVQGRKVGYATDTKTQKELYDWLRENPHRLHLGRVGLVLKNASGGAASSKDLSGIHQMLDLWTGTIKSQFEVAGQTVSVRTCCHPDMDLLAVRIESPLLMDGRASVQIEFPYGSPQVDMADWKSTQKHTSQCALTQNRARISRQLDQDAYTAELGWNQGEFKQLARHQFGLTASGNVLELTLRFAREFASAPLPSVDQTLAASADHWQKFWTSGGAIDFSGSTDPRAAELERRVVLSQYNTALHCSGSMPPPETGLLFNSWYGKSHLEMHWWHGVHFAAWNRFDLLERSLDYYHRIMPVARATAVRQGYAGVRWPKMVGPDGRDSPSPIAPLLIWHQPHPIYYAELCYSQQPTQQTLKKWKQIVFESADFIASYAYLDGDRYVIGPPMKTVSENTDTNTAHNPTFELAYCRMGLRLALEWKKRLAMPADEKWVDVLTRLSPLPVAEGVYLMQEGMTDTYTHWNWEHPALLGALGAQPGDGVDTQTMRATLKKVMQVWDWDRCWGWDFPMAAMTAARLGEGTLAINALLIESIKNRYLPNGHVYQRENLTAYLPANGGLLAAVATMATHPGGFPTDGKWTVRAENLSALL